MDCPKCNSSTHKKNGIVDGRQRYKCHDCGYNYSVELKSTASPTSVKRQALQLYLEGLGFRSIGRFLGVSHVSVQKWIKKFGRELEDLKSEKEISIVEMDEMHTYIGNKKNIAGYGLLLIEFGKKFINCSFGSRGTETGQLIWEKLKTKKIEEVMTDHWKPYAEFIPETIHTQSKAETYTVEGYNSIFRHFLARLRRKTKCYTKSLEMLKYSVLLLMKHRNKELAIFG
ncbi:IS1 family transposase [Methanosarcina mazei]|uniref:IS1 family transposase n=2 Tax=Methanosarcina mazei TaxID=2209 RepID=A0A4V1FAD0_METMZ|nr:IS1-like element ISMma7 family transposase [Methanosarcina mazei]QCR14873.1 IS1 family transposase [Methanosarcina mazei]QCR14909.1 IS1 family transposase [Methanosarcina mazei]QCR16731.1 IS1 family transposase [Methanosarcina mazei]